MIDIPVTNIEIEGEEILFVDVTSENNTVKLDIYFTVKGLNNQQFTYQYEYSNLKKY